MSTSFTVNGVSSGQEELLYNVVAPRFFDIIDTPLLAGRDFTDRDDETAPAVAIVNEAFARRWLPEGTSIGQRVFLNGSPREAEIVGVVKDAVYETLRQEPPPTVYLPFSQTKGRPMTLLVAATALMGDVSTALRTLIQLKVPQAAAHRTLSAQRERSLFSNASCCSARSRRSIGSPRSGSTD